MRVKGSAPAHARSRYESLALFVLRAGEIKEVKMLNSVKSSVPEKDKSAAANAAEVVGRTVQPHDLVWATDRPRLRSSASCLEVLGSKQRARQSVGRTRR